MKKCYRCGLTKSLDSFQKDRHKLDGHKYYCKECAKLQYRKNRKQILEKAKKYKKSVLEQKGIKFKEEVQVIFGRI